MKNYIPGSISTISLTSLASNLMRSDAPSANENRDQSNKSRPLYSVVKRHKTGKGSYEKRPSNNFIRIDDDEYSDFYDIDETEFESKFCEFPQRSNNPSAMRRSATRRPVNPVHSRLMANIVVKYQHLAQFQSFMERYHCYPYVTEFKFPINMWINENLEAKKQEAVKTSDEEEVEEALEAEQVEPVATIEQELSQQLETVVSKPLEPEEEKPDIVTTEPTGSQEQFDTVPLHEEEELLPSLIEEEEDSSFSNSDSDEGEQIEDVDIFIVDQCTDSADAVSEVLHGEIEQDIDTISSYMSFRTRDYNYIYDLSSGPFSESKASFCRVKNDTGVKNSGNSTNSSNKNKKNSDDDNDYDDDDQDDEAGHSLEESRLRQTSFNKIKEFIGLLKYEKPTYVKG